MTKIRALVVDDEPLALSFLQSKLKNFPQIDIVGSCQNGREAIEATLELNPDLLFLDIQMPGFDGFEVVKRLQEDVMPMVIFTTAFEQYALDAFEVHAVDYILKPLDEAHIKRAVDRALERLQIQGNSSEASSEKSRVIGAINKIQNMNTAESDVHRTDDTRIVIKERDEILLVPQEDIAWIDAAGDYCCLHVNGETLIKRIPLKDMLLQLDPIHFKRVHRSTIVNLNFVQKVLPQPKGEFFLVLTEYDKVKVSRNYKEAIKNLVNKN